MKIKVEKIITHECCCTKLGHIVCYQHPLAEIKNGKMIVFLNKDKTEQKEVLDYDEHISQGCINMQLTVRQYDGKFAKLVSTLDLTEDGKAWTVATEQKYDTVDEALNAIIQHEYEKWGNKYEKEDLRLYTEEPMWI